MSTSGAARHPAPGFFKSLRDGWHNGVGWLYRRLGEFFEAEIPVRAAALAYHTLLSIVPTIALIFWYLKRIGITKQWHEVTRNFILSHLNVGSGDSFVQTFDKLTVSSVNKQIGVGLIGLLIVLYTSWNLIMRLGDTLDRILESKPVRVEWTRHFAFLILRRLFILFALPLALLGSLVVTTWLMNDSFVSSVFKTRLIGPYLGLGVSWMADVVAIYLIYRYVPRRIVPAGKAIKAALFIGPSFEFLKIGMVAYSTHAITVQKVYGALAAIPLTVFWVQLVWTLILTGGLFIKHPPPMDVLQDVAEKLDPRKLTSEITGVKLSGHERKRH